ncbi:MAG: zinc ribbon domain-containing protein [Gammaproteobacteria bacterium]|nr:zinc ribbon domain-containing protein [Gammaproteobacteria bacterium]
MPFYEYRCEDCGHELEAMQKMSDAPLMNCPECGKPALKKLISAAGFRLKGGGWYETDFKHGKKKNLHESGSGDSKSTAGKSDSKKGASTGQEKKESKPAKAPKSTSAN